LSDKRIQQWIHHDEFENNIYLFLRTSFGQKYTYLGRLEYLSHDQERERPVYFQWQIIDWSMPLERRSAIGLKPQPATIAHPQRLSVERQPTVFGELSEVPGPARTSSVGQKTSQFRAQKSPDYSVKDEIDRNLGARGRSLSSRRKENGC
jgi:hypothetical protein